MHDFIPVNIPLLDGNEKKYLNECIDTGWISSEGSFIKRFEEEMAAYVGRKYAIAVSNGTAALEAAVQALQIEKGSEVIMPAFTIMSCAQAIVKAGLVPVVVDCAYDTWNMDVTLVEEKITSKTKAIMIVHIYGLTVDITPIQLLAQKYNLKIIEDAAQVHGQTYKGKQCGSFGDISTFSFYPNKLVTCGEGGMILTDDEGLAERCRSIRNLCFQSTRRFVHEEIGSNFRMTNMQAALGVAQLEKLEATVLKKRKIGMQYRSLLGEIEGIRQPLEKTLYTENIYWVYGLVIENSTGYNAMDAMQWLKEHNIGTRPFFYPIHKQPVLLRMGLFQNESCPNAEIIAEQGFYIPSGVGLTEEDIVIVSNSIKEFSELIHKKS
ncbi:MAG: DegT/DnrJ/EryC1/StrS family aminotransferase [Lachnospiraceae bacterium]